MTRVPCAQVRAPTLALLGLLAVALCGASAWAQTGAGRQPTMGVEELRPGMRGVGRTVVRGTDPEEFQVEIIGVLEDLMPKQDVVVARLSGLDLENTGVAAGMSGSPVYIDGRLIGAVAYQLGQFPKEPIAGITPIASMERLSRAEQWRGNVYPASSSLGRHLLAAAAELLVGREPDELGTLFPNKGAIGVAPIITPVTIGGVHPDLVARLLPLFEALGWRPTLGGSSANSQVNGPPRPGSAVAAQLVRGDVTVAATGTVTLVDGDTVLAFGHPFMQSGSVDYPMAGGEVILVLSSLATSQKLTAVGSEIIGAVRQDLQPGILGVIGAQPRTIPVAIEVDGGRGAVERIDFEMVSDENLSATLLFIGVANGLSSLGKVVGDSTFEVDGEITLVDEDLDTVRIRNLFSSRNQAHIDLAMALTTIFGFVYDNPFEAVEVDGISLRIRARDDLKTAAISRVWSDRVAVRPGETVNLSVWLRPNREQEVLRQFAIAIPEDTPPGPLTLLVGDATVVSDEEQSIIQGSVAPANLGQMLRLLNKIRSNDTLYVQASRAADGALVAGRPMPSLPVSVLQILSTRQTSGGTVRLRRTVVLEEEARLDYLVEGEHRIELTVRNR